MFGGLFSSFFYLPHCNTGMPRCVTPVLFPSVCAVCECAAENHSELLLFFFSFFQSVKSMMVPSIDTSFQTCWQFLYGLYSCSVQSPTAVIPYGITSMMMKCKDAMKLQHPCFVWARGESEVLKRKVNCTVSWSPVPSCFLYHSCNQVVGFACVLCFTLEN